jgi:hypothetical protein
VGTAPREEERKSRPSGNHRKGSVRGHKGALAKAALALDLELELGDDLKGVERDDDDYCIKPLRPKILT